MCPHSPSCLSETALLYVAESVCTNTLRNATKVTGDKAHATHLSYTHWINGVRATAEIMSRHGITPNLNQNARNILPDLALINDYFNATPAKKVTAKRNCQTVVTNMFGANASFAGHINSRVLRPIKFYGKERSLLAMMKMWGAYHVKMNKKRGQFLLGGTYCGTKQPQNDMRDSLFLKRNASRLSAEKVEDFLEMSLISNDSFLSPQDLAASIFRCVGNKAPQALKHGYNTWKRANNLPYVETHNVDASDGEEGTGGGGGGGGTRQKKLTKQALIEPLEDLSKALESLNEVLVGNGNLEVAIDRLQHLVTNKFNTIASIVNHRVSPKYTNDNDNGDDISDSNDEPYDEEDEDEQSGSNDEDENEQKESNGIKGIFSDSDSDSDAESDDGKGEDRKHGSETEESDDDDNNGESEDNDDRAAEEDVDASPVDDSENALHKAPTEETEVEIEENDAEGSSQLQTQPEPGRLHDNMNEAQERRHISQFVKTLQTETQNISEVHLPNKEIKGILALSKQPNASASHKGYFYAFKSSQLNEIEAAYKAITSDPPDDPQGDGWVAKIARYVKHIKRDGWHNSFADLPIDGNTPENNVLLLWKIDAIISNEFCDATSPAKNTRKRTGQTNQSSPSSVNGLL